MLQFVQDRAHCEYEIVQQATAANNLHMHLAAYEQRLALAPQIYINSTQVIFKHQRIIFQCITIMDGPSFVHGLWISQSKAMSSSKPSNCRFAAFVDKSLNEIALH